MYSLRDVLFYILKRLDKVEGLKKLMKLLFLIQYEVRRPFIRKRYVVKYLYDNEPIIRTDFYIWRCGTYSDDVYRLVDEEADRGTIVLNTDEYGRTIISLGKEVQGVVINLPEKVCKRIDKILDKYGYMTGTQLEMYVLKEILMFREPVEKEDWYGVPVDDYFKKVNIRLRQLDLLRQCK